MIDICNVKIKKGGYKANLSPQNKAWVKLSFIHKKQSIGVYKAIVPHKTSTGKAKFHP